MHFACVRLHVKAINADTRTISGIASTPDADRNEDVVEPLGATFANPLPLLLHHDRKLPVGTATLTATPEAITFTASLPTIDTPGPLRDRVDETWQSLQAGLIRGVSIGLRPLKDGLKFLKSGGLHFVKSEIVELSLVTIPANVDASILAIKSLDMPHLAALGLTPSGVADTLPVVRAKGASAMATHTTTEQISAFEATRAAKSARMAELMNTAAAGGVTLDAAQTEEYDGLELEVKSVDAHLVRLRALDRMNVAAAAAVNVAANGGTALTTKAAAPVITVKANVPPGTGFLRYCQAKAYGNGDSNREIAWAAQWRDTTPEVELVLKAAVAVGTSTDATWAGPLAQLKPLSDEFLELLRPATYLGKIPGFLKVPFNVSVPSQTGGGTYSWVGEGAPKPVTKAQFGSVTLLITKCAGIIVITEELARSSSPDAISVLRREMVAGISQFLDQQFLDPTVAAVAGVNPASVTNGVTPITSTGTSTANARTDIQALIAAMTAAGITTSGAALIMSESNAAALGAALNPLGQPLFPNVNSTGGSVQGISIYASQTASSNVVLLQPSCVLYADDGGVTIDISREASVQMDSAPMNPADATVVMRSLWQTNSVGLRAERFINWKKARAGCVQYTVQTYTV